MTAAELEQKIDADGLESVIAEFLEACQEICHGNAEHIESNWGDEYAARTWGDDAETIQRAINLLEALNN